MSYQSGKSFRIFYVIHAVINLVQVKHEFNVDQSDEALRLAAAYKRSGYMVQLQRKSERCDVTSEDLPIPGEPNEPRLR